MKIVTLIISMIISMIGIAQSHITGIYSINSSAENIECNIYFYKSGSYYLNFLRMLLLILMSLWLYHMVNIH